MPEMGSHYPAAGNLGVVLLCGGDNGTQRRDMAKARTLAQTLEA
jgi:putative component of toxin-antitoxin plasmid stabilization module